MVPGQLDIDSKNIHLDPYLTPYQKKIKSKVYPRPKNKKLKL